MTEGTRPPGYVPAMKTSLVEMKSWVKYTEADAVRLAALVPTVEPHVNHIVDRFYDEIERHPESNAILSGPKQVERLKVSLRKWLRDVFVGPHDEAYAERRRMIGWMHVQVGLPDRYMFTAMHLIESELIHVFRSESKEPWADMDSLCRVLTMDLALMTGSYVEARELRQLDSLQALLIEHLRVVVLLVGDDGRVSSATKSVPRSSDPLGQPWQEVLPAGLAAAGHLDDHVRRALELGNEVTLPRVDVLERSYRVHIVPLRHELAAFLLQVEELTDTVEMEARVRRSEALAQLGALSAAVAHELRNPLAGMSGALQVITRSMEPGTTHHDILHKVDGELRRLNLLVTDLLAFARPGTAKVMETALRPLVDEVVGLLAPEHPDVSFELDGEGVASADPHLIRQILHNVFRNAVDAVDGNGTIWVDVGSACVRVTDSGAGVPAEARATLFEPFVTTKTRGTGLGLAISMRSAQAMGGTLVLEDGGRGPGACFCLAMQAV